jgi:predicted P-loop ATPase/5S rRNA maturation endonuclease (ribonuclease M5)
MGTGKAGRGPAANHAAFAPYMGIVAKKLLGEPNRRLSNGHELRYGTHGSLSVDIEKGVWRDHENEQGGGVLKLVQRRLNYDRPDALDWLRRNVGLAEPTPAKAKPARGNVEASYVYTNAEYQPVHRTLRWRNPKRFSQQRFENGKWIGGKGALNGVERVLYHMPEVLRADEVVITEGEKDADRLRSLGFTATTNPEGAKKWQSSFAEVLAGKQVIILPDNDAAGRGHVEKIAASLHGKAASVKVLELEGLPPKGDVSDWLDAGHKPEELRELIAGVPEWESKPVDWRAKLLEGRQGPLALEANVVVALRYAPEFSGRLRFNELSQTVECRALPWRRGEAWRPWTDVDDTELAVWCQHCGIRVKPPTCTPPVLLVARGTLHHPVRSYLGGLAWDGTERLGDWLNTYLGVAYQDGRHMAYVQGAGRKVLIQAVARVMEPGCQADYMLLLEGPQGIGKSSAVRALAKNPDWFADEIADLGSKDAAQDLRGKWIIELGELAAMKRAEIERIKAFIPRRTDHYRPSFGRWSQDFPRQCVFFGTTNSDSYLQDETGARRFWPVKATRIDLEGLRRDVDQLWAEAVAAYRAGERRWLDSETERIAVEQQAERSVGDPWEDTLLDWASRRVLGFTVAEALKEALQVPLERQDQTAMNRVARTLKAHGWKRVHRREGTRWKWVYERPGPPGPDGGQHSPTGHVDAATGHKAGAPDAPSPTGHKGDESAPTGHSGHGKSQLGQACDQCDQCDHLEGQIYEEDDRLSGNSVPKGEVGVSEPYWSRGHTGHRADAGLNPLDDPAELTIRGEMP